MELSTCNRKTVCLSTYPRLVRRPTMVDAAKVVSSVAPKSVAPLPPANFPIPATPVGKGAKRALPGTHSAKKSSAAKKPKRKKEDAKSTTTTTTATADKPVNVYDSVLGEAEDLLKAAMEAQALGRLKMASAYQLLLHARLVGLGKRFDRAQVIHTGTNNNKTKMDATKNVSACTTSPGSSPPPKVNESPVATEKVATEKNNTPEAKQEAIPAEELAKVLPTGIELDQGMMEHLARAAMELHHKRTGRRIQSDTPPKVVPTTSATGVAWTEDELVKFQEIIKKGKTDPDDIAKAVGTRTEAQVRAYLRNTQERQKGARAVEQEWGETTEGDHEKHGGGEEVSPRKRGGRGRKPATTAMNTVPNAKLDARFLLSGNAL